MDNEFIVKDPKVIWWHETMACMGESELTMPEFLLYDYFKEREMGTLPCPIGSVMCYQWEANIVHVPYSSYIDKDTPEGDFKDCHAKSYRHEYTHAIEYQTDQVVSCDEECGACGNGDSTYCDYVCNRWPWKSCSGRHGSWWFFSDECIRRIYPDECPAPPLPPLE